MRFILFPTLLRRNLSVIIVQFLNQEKSIFIFYHVYLIIKHYSILNFSVVFFQKFKIRYKCKQILMDITPFSRFLGYISGQAEEIAPIFRGQNNFVTPRFFFSYTCKILSLLLDTHDCDKKEFKVPRKNRGKKVRFLLNTTLKHKKKTSPRQSMCYFAPIQKGGSKLPPP